MEFVPADDSHDVSTVKTEFWDAEDAEDAECLTGRNLGDYDFIQVTKNGVWPIPSTGQQE